MTAAGPATHPTGRGNISQEEAQSSEPRHCISLQLSNYDSSSAAQVKTRTVL